ncbi:HNH endonuclease [Cobetia sp. QF-1]|uniref:HNH endonuclease n=1 Tax=Cobetia sp. QF-1 TaxID=1969833 RepID=UPI000B53F3CD|nr:HNH endonuclease signature motif containing protein [Cobetia sp. QF-1]
MMRLNNNLDYEGVIDACGIGINGNIALRSKLLASKNDLLTMGEQYAAMSVSGSLYSIEPLLHQADINDAVVCELSKPELVKLYERYFVLEEKPARRLYDAILNSAEEKCPFCGGIGTPRNLDHFLPKSHFPQFSILPSNLVPSCRDCNMDGKASSYATKAGEQLIQPYIDNDVFFDDQWIFADFECDDTGLGWFNFYVKTPREWNDINKVRAIKHFEDFNLNTKYGNKAAQNLVYLQEVIRVALARGDTIDDVIDMALKPAITAAMFPNHWHKVMCQAMIDFYRS